MAEEEQNRSEQPTSFKLARAREKGSVARGMDMGFMTGLAAFLAYGWVGGRDAVAQIAGGGQRILAVAGDFAAGDAGMGALAGVLISVAAPPLLALCAVIFAVVLLFELIQTGFVFSAQPLNADFNRLNPAQGLKRLFTVRLLIEAAKNILKLAVYATVGWLIVRNAIEQTDSRVANAYLLSEHMWRGAFRLIGGFLLVSAAFAVLDQLIVRRDYRKRMRMSRREVRREMRDREGEPRLKQRRKQLHAEFVKASRSLRGIRGADVLIVNPQHVAVALRYDRRVMSAPMVVAAGADKFAQRLKRLAFLFGVPIVEDRLLARELFRRCPLNREIPDHCYRAAAAIYNALNTRSDG